METVFVILTRRMFDWDIKFNLLLQNVVSSLTAPQKLGFNCL